MHTYPRKPIRNWQPRYAEDEPKDVWTVPPGAETINRFRIQVMAALRSYADAQSYIDHTGKLIQPRPGLRPEWLDELES